MSAYAADVNHRSLVFDLFGGYVRYDGGAIALQDLAAVTEPFGVSAGALRVVMSRLRREDWFAASRAGERTLYRATPQTWQLLNEGYERIFGPVEPWRNEWYVVVYEVPESERSIREQLRKQLSWLGFGSLAASTWLSPRDRLDAVLSWAQHQPAVRIHTLVARSRDVEQDRQFAARCWNLDATRHNYAKFLQRYGSPDAATRWRSSRGSDALIERVHLAHDYRLLFFRDPNLPAHLLPSDWPAARAAELFAEAFTHLEPEAKAAYRSLVTPGEQLETPA
jgi:phenylacetic acid degradation operon negative regulatory protein